MRYCKRWFAVVKLKQWTILLEYIIELETRNLKSYNEAVGALPTLASQLMPKIVEVHCASTNLA
jgi:hypothetical protein